MNFRPSCCALISAAMLVPLSLSGCRGKQTRTAASVHEPPAPSESIEFDSSEDLTVPPPSPPRTARRPRLIPGGPTQPLSSPPREEFPGTGLPLPAPPADDY